MKSRKVGINGFGRIGRCLLRLGSDLDIVAINSPAPVEMSAHLLQYDSVHGPCALSISTDKNILQVGHKKIHYTSYLHPKDIPWQDLGVDVVLECSGIFKKREDLEAHFKGGAKVVFVAAPVSDGDFTVIYGVNQQDYQPEKHRIISNGSCTTNCLAPMIKVLHENFHIQELLFTTVHAYTLDQKILDSSHKKDMRRARAAHLSMIPTSTGAAGSLMDVFPGLKGKLKGMAVRVPVPNVSLVDMVFCSRTKAPVEKIKQAFLSAEEGELKNILKCETQELVSVDFNGRPYSCIVDIPSIMAIEGGMIKVLAWYDNETGFSQRMLDFIPLLKTDL